MERQVGVAPVVQCPGCNQPMEPKERAQVTDRLVDIRYVCPVCGMETKRTVRVEA
jgi:ribosomal protein L44E